MFCRCLYVHRSVEQQKQEEKQMKQKILVLLTITTMILSTFSIGVMAIGNTESIPIPSDNIESPSEPLFDNESLNSENITQAPVLMVINESYAKRDNCVILDELLVNEYVDQFKVTKHYPLVIDLKSFAPPVDSIIFPESLLNVLIADESSNNEGVTDVDNNLNINTNNTNGDSNSESINNLVEPTDNEAETIEIQTDEVVLKIITQNAEYSWKRRSLSETAITNGLVKIGCVSADHTVQQEIKETDKIHDKSSLKFAPKEEKNSGILFVSKNDEGYWDITSEYLFGSIATYVIAIIFLIILTFALIIAVNLLIIRIYKTKK